MSKEPTLERVSGLAELQAKLVPVVQPLKTLDIAGQHVRGYLIRHPFERR